VGYAHGENYIYYIAFRERISPMGSARGTPALRVITEFCDNSV
jgi:hypothetical protein